MTLAQLLNNFSNDLDSLLAVDISNHTRTAQGVGLAETSVLTVEQLHLITEGLFFSAYRAFENYLENAFILCLVGEPTSRNFVPISYLQPKDVNHARELIKAGQSFLDWTSPDNVISRAETYLEDGKPFNNVLPSHLVPLRNMKKLRNHIAHNSKESEGEYKKLVRDLNNGVLPLQTPTPGELLLQQSSSSASSHYLIELITTLRAVAGQISEFQDTP